MMEGNSCEFPMWSYSKKRSGARKTHIKYPDGSYALIVAPEGMPSINFAGYLDVILSFCQHDLFEQNYVEISVYQILKILGKDPNKNSSYKNFRLDMKKAFAMYIQTNRFRNPDTGQRDYTDYFHILSSMRLSHCRNKSSKFFFDPIFIESFRAKYFKYLDFQFCIELDKNQESLARFLYEHIIKRLGGKLYYQRNLDGFLNDVGLQYIAEKIPKRKNQDLKRTLMPTFDRITGKAFKKWERDGDNIVFYGFKATKSIKEYQAQNNKKLAAQKHNRKIHKEAAMEAPSLYVKQCEIYKKDGRPIPFPDLYKLALSYC